MLSLAPSFVDFDNFTPDDIFWSEPAEIGNEAANVIACLETDSSFSSVARGMTNMLGDLAEEFGFEGLGALESCLAPNTDSVAPEVLGILTDAEAGENPLQIQVQFSEAMSLKGLQFGVLLSNSQGQEIVLHATAYDESTNTVTYAILNRPVGGTYELRFHEELVTDLAGNSLSPDGAQRDFRVEVSPASFGEVEPNNSVDNPQQLGPIYYDDLDTSVQIVGTLTASGEMDYDLYSFKVPAIFLGRVQLAVDNGSVADLAFRIWSDAGQLIGDSSDSETIRIVLHPGIEYFFEVSGLATEEASYHISFTGFFTAPPRMVVGDVPGFEQQVVLRPRGAVASYTETWEGESTSAPNDSTPIPVVFAVNALPQAVGQPLGRPQIDTPPPTLLAWSDHSSPLRDAPTVSLPPGYAIRPALPQSVPVSAVDSVSGSFHEPLAESLPTGIDALVPSPSSVAELVTLLHHDWSHGPGNKAADAHSFDVHDLAIEHFDSDRAVGDEQRTARVEHTDQPRLATLGVVVGLGLAGALTMPRSGSSHWVRRTFQWLSVK